MEFSLYIYVSTNELTLIKNDVLTTESAGQSIIIKELYSIDLVYNQIGGSSNVIASVDNNDFFSIGSLVKID